MTTLTRPLRRQTVGTLDGTYCSDRGKRLVVSLEPGDLITIRPAKTRRVETIAVTDVYRWALRNRINKEAADKKAAKRAKRLGLTS